MNLCINGLFVILFFSIWSFSNPLVPQILSPVPQNYMWFTHIFTYASQNVEFFPTVTNDYIWASVHLMCQINQFESIHGSCRYYYFKEIHSQIISAGMIFLFALNRRPWRHYYGLYIVIGVWYSVSEVQDITHYCYQYSRCPRQVMGPV